MQYLAEHLCKYFPTKFEYHYPNDIQYPSITKVLYETADRSALEAWIQRVGKEEAERISKQATSRGNRVQDIIDYYLIGEEIPNEKKEKLHKRDWIAFNTIKKFLNQIDQTYAIEIPVISHKLQMKGRLDWLGIINGKPAVIDWKTTKKEKKEEWIEDYKLQTVFYAIAIYEITGIKPDAYVVLINEVFYQKFNVKINKQLLETLYQRRKQFENLYGEKYNENCF